MPYINGIETIRMIREKLDAVMQKKPIILLHSSVNRGDIGEECKKIGIKYNIQKPVKSKDLFNYLSAILKKDDPRGNNFENIENENQVKILSLNTPLILIAEDVFMNMTLVKTMIKQFLPEARIVEALNGKMALDIYLNEKVDLILMDVQMPEMDGIEATREIRKFEKERGQYTPIVALSAGAIKEEKERCVESGMDDFIAKPVEGKNLLDILKKYILKERVSKNKTEEREELTKIISFDKEELMDKIYNNKSLYQELINVSLEEMPEHINDLTRFIKEKNLVEIKRVAHKIKGSALNMCFKKIARIARLIEENYEKDMDYVLELSKEIEEEWEKVCAYF